MGRHSSDSEEERKKRKKKKKKRSRSRSKSSESRYSSKLKKSKKSKNKKRKNSRSRSRSVDSYRRSRSRSRGRRSRSYERSRSYDRYRSRSGSGSRSKHSRRSRSLSRSRYSRSRSRERNRRRSRSYDRYSRRSSRSRSPSRKNRKRYSEEREDPCLTIPGFSQLPPVEQAKIRMQMALKAAAAADEKIKGDVMEKPTSFKDQLAFNQALQDIESSGFEAKYFTSNSWDKKEDSSTSSKDEFTFGTAGEIKLDSYQKRPVVINVDTDDLADPSLYADPEEKMDRWIQRLAAMRKRKLEGDVLT